MPLFLRCSMSGLPIPDDWDKATDGFCDLTLAVPNSQLWRSLVRGQVLNLGYPYSYDPDTAVEGGPSDTFDGQISFSTDDAHQNANGSGLVVGALELRCIADASDATRSIVGLRFQGVTVPNSANIVQAHLSLNPQSTANDDANLELKGELASNPPQFLTQNITSRSQTAAGFDWVQDALGTAAIDSPDISPIVQEIVNQPGWASGNSMVLFLVGKSDVAKNLYIVSWNGNPSIGPRLHIEYGIGGGTSPELAAEIGMDIFNSVVVDCP